MRMMKNAIVPSQANAVLIRPRVFEGIHITKPQLSDVSEIRGRTDVDR